MGFSTIGATVILFAGFLFFSSMVANSLFEAQRETSAGLDDDRRRDEFVRNTDVTLVNGNHAGGEMHLNLTNRGGSVLDASLVNLVIDGAWSTDQITSRTIGGASTDVWAPGETLYLRATQAATPDRVLAVIETGGTVVWTS